MEVQMAPLIDRILLPLIFFMFVSILGQADRVISFPLPKFTDPGYPPKERKSSTFPGKPPRTPLLTTATTSWEWRDSRWAHAT